jgi:probable phosphoglycerate mutase
MALPRAPFWFLRHGQTDYNARGVSQGSVDIPLNATGIAQAHNAAPLLEGRGITAVVTSPMQRALVTAQIVNQTLNLPLTIEPDLREVVFGGMEGKPLGTWFADWLDGTATPEGAESFAEITTRAETIVSRLLLAPAPLLIVAHGAFFRALRGVMGLELDIRTENATPILCEPVALGWRATKLM